MTSDNATTPAATPAVQEPRVNDAEMRISARIAEQQPVQNYSVVDRFALDLRDARTALAERERELAAEKARNRALEDKLAGKDARVEVLLADFRVRLKQIAADNPRAWQKRIIYAFDNFAAALSTKEEPRG